MQHLAPPAASGSEKVWVFRGYHTGKAKLICRCYRLPGCKVANNSDNRPSGPREVAREWSTVQYREGPALPFPCLEPEELPVNGGPGH
jgi:hypothetical protein